jgi:type 1 fimbria pilin
MSYKKIFSIVNILLVLILSLLNTAPALADSEVPTTFKDTFSGTKLDSKKWNQIVPSGAYISVNGGELNLGVTNAQHTAYPFINTVNDPIEGQAYTIKVRFRFQPSNDTTRPIQDGVVIAAMAGQQPNQVFGNSPAVNATSFWMRETSSGFQFGFGVYHQPATEPYDTNWHTLEFERTGSTYNGTAMIIFDHRTIATTDTNLAQPTNIWMGVAGSTLYQGTFTNWPEIEVARVVVHS